MSDFVCLLDRSGAAIDPAQLDRLAAPLAYPAGTLSKVCRGPVAIAVRHLEGVGGRQPHRPLAEAPSGLVVALAGHASRVREGATPGPPDGAAAAPAGAAQLLDAWPLQGAGLLAGMSGSFVVLAADPHECWLSLARDHLGTRKVYYHLDRRWLIAASEPAMILRHGAVTDVLDQAAAARFLGFDFSHGERSFFTQIQELAPAHQLYVTGGESRVRQYWRFQLRRGERRRSRPQVHSEFLGQLRQSIARELAELAPEQVGISFSGGLDSTALAALAPRGVRAFSWYFEDAAQRDERRNVEAAAEHLKLPVRWVDGAGFDPLGDEFVNRFVHVGSPYLNAFAALKSRLYQVAREAGCERIMVGDGGDALFSAQEYWLRDTLAGVRPKALASLAKTLGAAVRGDAFARRSLRRLLPLPGSLAAIRRPRRPWLTAEADSLLPARAPSPILPDARGEHRYELSVGAKHTELESEEGRLFAQCGIGRSNPFWSWPLLEMVINLPAYWYHHEGSSKVLTREALQGLLPASVLASGRVGLLGSLFLRGIAGRRDDLRETVFRRPRSDWQRYVQRSWLEPYLSATGSIQFGHTILWRVICYELWQRRLIQPQLARTG